MIIPDNPDDLLLDPNFRPCRSEKCGRTYVDEDGVIQPDESLHAEHEIDEGAAVAQPGRRVRRCPKCKGRILRRPNKRAKCRRCAWRGASLTCDVRVDDALVDDVVVDDAVVDEVDLEPADVDLEPEPGPVEPEPELEPELDDVDDDPEPEPPKLTYIPNTNPNFFDEE